MKTFNDFEHIKGIDDTVVAMGNFDGVHTGHMELIKRSVAAANSAGMSSAVFTFSNHPRNFFKEGSVKRLISHEEKCSIINSLGVDYLFDIPFDDAMACMSAKDYVEKLLLNTLNMKEAYCGFNYRFGNKASGNTKLLMKMSLEMGFGIHVMEPYDIDGEIVSSTKIREFIENGDVKKAGRFLGRYYSIKGNVERGNEIGRTIGFPTANLSIDERFVSPANGVYASICQIGDEQMPSITNVGVKPTIGEYDKNVETHIFNFEKDIYGIEITTKLIKMIRPEKKFQSVDELRKQIENDCINVKAFHRTS